jgi:hypothetical protein
VTTFRRLGQTFASSHIDKIFSRELVRAMDFEMFERAEEGDDDDDPMDVDEQTIVIKREQDLMVG